jgi:hypothetical protein
MIKMLLAHEIDIAPRQAAPASMVACLMCQMAFRMMWMMPIPITTLFSEDVVRDEIYPKCGN